MVHDGEFYCLGEKYPSQVGYVYDRLVSFQGSLVSVHGPSAGGILVLNPDRMTKFSKQDCNTIGQDGKCNQQAEEIHGSTVFRWAEPQSVQSCGGLVKYETCLIVC